MGWCMGTNEMYIQLIIGNKMKENWQNVDKY